MSKTIDLPIPHNNGVLRRVPKLGDMVHYYFSSPHVATVIGPLAAIVTRAGSGTQMVDISVFHPGGVVSAAYSVFVAEYGEVPDRAAFAQWPTPMVRR